VPHPSQCLQLGLHCGNVMRRSLALILAAFLFVASLAGCQNEPATPARGETQGQTYHSRYLNITFTLPDGWSFYTDSQLEQQSGMAIGLLVDPGTEFSKGLMDHGAFYDMYAHNEPTASSVGLLYQFVGEANGEDIGTEDFLRHLMSGLPDFEFTFSDQFSRSIGGKSYTGMHSQINFGSATVYYDYYVIKIGGYFVAIVITSNNQDPESIFEHFN